MEEEPLKILHLGISPEGIPLEVVTIRTSRGDAVIHAMRMRTKYVRLPEGGGR
ncbi:toxin [Bifidobacterium eulemuris]|nr:toxin [Bifidobacterium eulemuris]